MLYMGDLMHLHSFFSVSLSNNIVCEDNYR